MASFRGTPLTHEAAEDLFLGWIDQPGQGAPRSSLLAPGQQGKPFSWLVAAGERGSCWAGVGCRCLLTDVLR